jgi:tetratricopeptide (TPR) repeat protein
MEPSKVFSDLTDQQVWNKRNGLFLAVGTGVSIDTWRSCMKYMAVSFFITVFSVSIFAQSDYDSYFAAWQDFRSGDYHKATVVTDQLVNKNPSDDALRGHVCYLKALLETKNDTETAISYLECAAAAYSNADMKKDRDNAEIALIRLYLQEDQVADAERELALKEDRTSGQYYHLRSRLAYKEGDYLSALELGEKCYLAFGEEGDTARAAQALNNQGLYLILLGHFDEGFKTTLKAQEGITRHGDVDQYFYTLANLILFQRGKNQRQPDHLINMIRERLKKEPDKDLENLLEFSLSYAAN